MAEAAGSKSNTILILTLAQALGSAGPPVIISLGGLVGQVLADNKALATLPVSLYTVGIALGTIPISLLMRRAGRRPAYLLGATAGICAGLIAAYAIIIGSFWLFCVGTALAGFNGACVQSYRFAAADAAGTANRGRAISSVMVGGLAAAVIGPQIVIWTRDLIPGVEFAASFIGQACLALLAFPLLSMLRTPPIVVTKANPGRPLREIATTPRFMLAVAAGMVTYGIMSFVMTAAPIAMVDCGHTVGEAALGIQWHVLAMFGPSFITGRLIQRFGEEKVTACGLALLACAAVMALTGLSLFHFWGTLILLGFGWNLGFIGATTMVAASHRPEERAKVQGLNDFLVFGSTAVASLFSGNLVEAAGWTTIAWLILPIVGVALVLLLSAHLLKAAPAAASGAA